MCVVVTPTALLFRVKPTSIDVADSSPPGAFQFTSRKKSDASNKKQKRVSAKIELGFCYLPKSSFKKAFFFFSA